MPPPTPSTAEPSAPNSTVRIATLSSHPATGDAKPTVPQYTPRRCCSQPVSSSTGARLGRAGDGRGRERGVQQRGHRHLERHARGHRRHQMPHARSGPHREKFGHGHRARHRHAAQVVADQVDDHDVLRDVLDRRPQRRGIRSPRQGALDRARRHRIARASQEQLRRQRRHRAPVAGQICRPRGRRAFHRVDEEVDRARRRACLRTACTHTPGRSRPRRSPPGSRARLGGGRRGRHHPRRCRSPSAAAGFAMRRQPSPKVLRRRGFRTTSARRCPGAARSPSSRPPPRGCGRVVRRRRHRDRTGSRTSRPRPRRRDFGALARQAVSVETSPVATADTVNDGAMTAPEPNHSPISAAGGGSPRRSAAAATARNTPGALPRSPSRSIRIDQACQTRRVISRRTSTPVSLSGLRIA